MTTYETWSTFLIVLQTTLLAMYGWETFRLRRDSADQNRLMSEQLKVMVDGLAFERKCIEEDDMPLLQVKVIKHQEESYGFKIESLKENIWFVEFRSNDPSILEYTGSQRHWRHINSSGIIERNIYLAVIYKTVRGKIGCVIYQYFTGHAPDQIKIVEGMDYRTLSIIQKAEPVL